MAEETSVFRPRERTSVLEQKTEDAKRQAREVAGCHWTVGIRLQHLRLLNRTMKDMLHWHSSELQRTERNISPEKFLLVTAATLETAAFHQLLTVKTPRFAILRWDEYSALSSSNKYRAFFSARSRLTNQTSPLHHCRLTLYHDVHTQKKPSPS